MGSTYFGLLAEFGAAEIPLSAICLKYFGLNEPEAKRRASMRRLPVPAYRGDSSQKCPWLINASDLAKHLDSMREAARSEHEKVNT